MSKYGYYHQTAESGDEGRPPYPPGMGSWGGVDPETGALIDRGNQTMRERVSSRFAPYARGHEGDSGKPPAEPEEGVHLSTRYAHRMRDVQSRAARAEDGGGVRTVLHVATLSMCKVRL